jgi:hypothetical protein
MTPSVEVLLLKLHSLERMHVLSKRAATDFATKIRKLI